MQIYKRAFGEYGTNCYIVDANNEQIIIDAGKGAKDWCKKYAKNPKAILCTHGHFDHVFDANILRDELNIPIYLPQDDEVFITCDPFTLLSQPFKADFLIKPNEKVKISNFECIFHHFAGHTPGCSCIEFVNIPELENAWFCGDFLFKGSIGRCDFEFSNPKDMKQSIQKVLEEKRNIKLYCGHGEDSFLDEERENLIYLLKLKLWQ